MADRSTLRTSLTLFLCPTFFLSSALFLCATLFLSGSLSAESPPDQDQLLQTAQDIQFACVEAYPVDILAEMTGTEEVPDDLVEDVERQRDYYINVINGDKGIFFPYLLEDLLPSFQDYIKPGTKFLDLGSGDGRVVFMAAALGAEATGIEYDPKVAEISRQALANLDDVIDTDLVTIIEDDFFNHSWAEYDYIFYFDRSSFAQKEVRRKLAYELHDEARLLVGFQHLPFHGLEVEAHYGDVTVFRQAALDEEFQPEVEKRAKAEISQLYEFLQGWYRATPEALDDGLQRIESVVSPSFSMIEPNGRIYSRTQAMALLRSKAGAWERSSDEETAKNRLVVDQMQLHLVDSTSAVFSFRERRHVDGTWRNFRVMAALQLRMDYPNHMVWHYIHRAPM